MCQVSGISEENTIDMRSSVLKTNTESNSNKNKPENIDVSTKILKNESKKYYLNFRIEFINDDEKIEVRLKAAGNAPVLKSNKIRISGTNKFASIKNFYGKI